MCSRHHHENYINLGMEIKLILDYLSVLWCCVNYKRFHIDALDDDQSTYAHLSFAKIVCKNY